MLKQITQCYLFLIAVDKIKKPSEERDEFGNSFTDGDGEYSIFTYPGISEINELIL